MLSDEVFQKVWTGRMTVEESRKITLEAIKEYEQNGIITRKQM